MYFSYFVLFLQLFFQKYKTPRRPHNTNTQEPSTTSTTGSKTGSKTTPTKTVKKE